MSLRKLFVTSALALAVSAAVPAKASADWLFTPFIGGNFGGSADVGDVGGFSDQFDRKLSYGASIAWMGAGVIGFEADFGYSPNFFGVSGSSNNVNFFGDGNVTTLMGNLVVGAPIGPVRPYVSGGLGLLKTSVDDAGDFFKDGDNNLGFDVGAGVMGFFTHNIGIRGDVRLFRAINNNSDDNTVDVSLSSFKFWRATVGVTFKF